MIKYEGIRTNIDRLESLYKQNCNILFLNGII